MTALNLNPQAREAVVEGFDSFVEDVRQYIADAGERYQRKAIEYADAARGVRDAFLDGRISAAEAAEALNDLRIGVELAGITAAYRERAALIASGEKALGLLLKVAAAAAV